MSGPRLPRRAPPRDRPTGHATAWRLLLLLLGVVALWWVAPPARAAEASPDYVLGVGDLIRISVFQTPELSLETRVTETGTISYPLLGSLKLGGLSVARAEDLIARGLRDGNFLKQPQVTLIVLQVRSNQVSVLGMVNRPGRYPIEINGTRLSEMLAQAGGVAPGGSDIVVLRGHRQGQPIRLDIDLPALLARSNDDDPVIANGDVLFVDRMPTVYVYGEVQRPGAVRLERDMTVMQALAAGGGLTLRGSDKGMRVHRRNGSGKLIAYEPDMEDKLRDGDVLHVPESIF